jgi:hypothetical protein
MPRRNRAWTRAAAAGTRWGGHPPAGRREHRVRFWEAIARGASSENAAVEAGVLPSIGVRWFRKGGGMPPLTFAPVSGRYLSFTEREECRRRPDTPDPTPGWPSFQPAQVAQYSTGADSTYLG